MAGTVASSHIKHQGQGVKRVTATFLCDASGDASEAVIADVAGRIVAIGLDKGPVAYDLGNTIFTLKPQGGAAILTLDTDASKFGSTTTGDTTGGAAEDLFTTGASHGLAAGDRITIISKTGGTLPTPGVSYYVIAANLAATTFQLSATLGGASIEIGASDITAMAWANQTQAPGQYFRPTAVIADNVGAAISAATSAPNVNRDIVVHGKLTLTVAQGGNLGTGDFHVIIDEEGLY